MLDAVPKYVIPAQVSSVADTAQFTPKTVETASEREKLVYRIIVQFLMQAAPTTHFVLLAQAILFRGAGFAVVWLQFVALALIGAVLFVLSLARFRQTLAAMA